MSEGNYFFKFKYQRFLTSTLGWKEEEQGAYLRLLIVQFDQGAIPSDIEEIAAISPAAKKHWPKLSKKFKNVDPDGRLYNLTMRDEWNKANGIKAVNKENGSKGGRPKKYKTEAESKPNGFSEETEGLSKNNPTDIYTNMVTGLLVSSEIKKEQPIVSAMADVWKRVKPEYPFHEETDGGALFEIGAFLANLLESPWIPQTQIGYYAILESWDRLSRWIAGDSFYGGFSLAYVAKTATLQTIIQKSKQPKNGKNTERSASTGIQPGSQNVDAIVTEGFGKL